jgi:transcriptional regulator with PAS, ATPase and Fis domain
MIHDLSGRKEGPFVKVNCAAIPASLLESELFGYERGAFSGATSRYKGKFQISQGGTLFLDEIGDLENSLQAKILQAIEEKRFYPLGSPRYVEVNCRILAASNRPLEEMVKEGRFRQDLYHRLMAFPIQVTPLRERKEDIRILAEYYLAAFSREMGNCPLEIAPRVWEFLTAYHWPGNVRELINILRSAVLMCQGKTLDLDAFSSYPILWDDGDAEELQPPANVISINPIPTLAQSEKDLIQRALQSCNGNKSQAARLLGISRSHLRYRMMLHNL